MLTISKTNMTGKALLCLNNGELIVYKKGKIIIYRDENIVKTINLPTSLLKKTLCKLRIIDRLLHADIRWAVEINTQKILFLFQNAIYLADIQTGVIKKEFSGFRGQPFSVTRDNKRILIGDYGTNDDRKKVNIYERKDGKWEVVYSFPEHSIRHIHNIVKSTEGFYILTGDEDSESGIWFADNRFTIVKPILIGSQQYRCCQMFEEKGTVLYLTDAPSESNHIYTHINENTNEISKIPGTCIYGINAFGGLLFSTTVEAEAHAKNKWSYWLSQKPGAGINGIDTHIMFLKDKKCTDLICFEHDRKPLRLFQYATVYFANGNDKNAVYCTPLSVKKHDNRIFRIMNSSDKG